MVRWAATSRTGPQARSDPLAAAVPVRGLDRRGRSGAGPASASDRRQWFHNRRGAALEPHSVILSEMWECLLGHLERAVLSQWLPSEDAVEVKAGGEGAVGMSPATGDTGGDERFRDSRIAVPEKQASLEQQCCSFHQPVGSVGATRSRARSGRDQATGRYHVSPGPSLPRRAGSHAGGARGSRPTVRPRSAQQRENRAAPGRTRRPTSPGA
jgi:hypothetical protein